MKSNKKVLRLLELLHQQRRKTQAHAKLNADINVTPLVDVVLVLLIIFMVVTPMLSAEINLPKVEHAVPQPAQTGELVISITEAREYQINTTTVAAAELKDRINYELTVSRLRPVNLRADATLPFTVVRPVLQALRDAGAENISFATLIDIENKIQE